KYATSFYQICWGDINCARATHLFSITLLIPFPDSRANIALFNVNPHINPFMDESRRVSNL
ncbi:MAG: hypothetical protein ACYDFU_08475, partial [Nitrospirota bacterium]